MAHVAPFRGIRFAPTRVPDLSRVVAPPYDVISPDFQRELHARDPHNIVHIDFGLPEPGDEPGRDRYARAAARLHEWLADGTLARDPRPALYLYEQEFDVAGLGRFVRRGFLGALRLSPFGDGVVFPHERTLSAPKADRLALLRATETDTSPVFAVYSDPADAALAALRERAGGPPDMTAVDEAGIAHRVWRIDHPPALAAAARDLAERRLFIADGHHRYETTLGWRDEQRARTGGRADAASDFILAFLCNMDAPGLVVLPTHRGVHSLMHFDPDRLLAQLRVEVPVETRDGSPDDACAAAAEAGRHGKALVWSASPDRFHVVSFPDVERLAARLLADVPAPLRTLDVVLLHELLFRRMLGIDPEEVTRGRFVRYYKEARKAAAELQAGSIQAAFFLNAVTADEFRCVSLSGHVLPQKTTFFYPKVLTGLVLMSAHPEDSVPG